jgi:hypothetical protein
MQQAISRKKKFYQRRSFYVRMCILLVLLSVLTFLFMFVLPLSSAQVCIIPQSPDGQLVCKMEPMPWWQAHQIRF